ncbi:MAG: hypothetical protein SGI73_01365 [Chloroflexota bacterium]|nr:hypothetical protein [Chloroflexota bacterium]
MNYAELLHRCAAPAWDKQMYLGDLIKDEPRWDSDLANGLLTFGKYTFRVQVLGSESDLSTTWLWGWANTTSNLPPSSFMAAHQLRTYGEQHKVAELMTAYHERSNTVNGHMLSMIAVMICGGNAYYRAPYDGGAVFLLLRDPAFPPQDYDPVKRITTYFPQVVSAAGLRDHRLALYSYMDYYQAQITTTTTELIGRFNDGRAIRANFDVLGRLASLKVEKADHPNGG